MTGKDRFLPLEKSYLGISPLVRVRPQSGHLAGSYIINDLTTGIDPKRKYSALDCMSAKRHTADSRTLNMSRLFL